MKRSDLYISVDVETDGPIPGSYSMLSLGMVALGSYDGRQFKRIRKQETFYKELRPISDQFQVEALRVNRLDRAALLQAGSDPVDAMNETISWVRRISGSMRPVLVAYPVAFDWTFLYWYLKEFATEESPFGHSSCLDIRTLYFAISGAVFDETGFDSMPEMFWATKPHTHNALDDAREQGEVFTNLLQYLLRTRNHKEDEGRDSQPDWFRGMTETIA